MSLYLRFPLLRLLAGTLTALCIANGCGMSSDSGNSNTNWLKSCTVTGDCAGGLECVCGTCSLPCTSNAACARLGTSAACASNAALRAVCSKEALPSASLCLPTCGPAKACGSGRVCVDGVCSPGEPPDASGTGGNSGSGGAFGASGGSPPGSGGIDGTGGIAGSTGGARTDGGAGASAGGATSGDGGSLVCGPLEYACACATGHYCLAGGAICIAPTSPCPADYAGCGTCAEGSVCVKDQTIGGALVVPNDAGACPPGRVVVPEAPQSCSPPPSFHCAPMARTCSAHPACECAQTLCNGECTDANSKLVQCLLRAP